jgi:hypothetical protein
MTQLTTKQVNAVKLAAWLYGAHPKLFQKLLAKANLAKNATSKTKNIAGLGQGCGCGPCARGLSGLGSGGVSAVSFTPIDTSSFIAPDLSSLDTGSISSAISSGSGSSGGFWSSLASGLSSLGSDVLSGIGSTASFLTSSTGLSSLTNLANTYFASQAATSQANAQQAIVNAQANTQQAIVNAQVQRTAAGYSPAPISYQTNAAGQLMPVYNSASGYIPLSTSGIASLASGERSSWLLPVGLGGAALIVLMLALKS